VRTYERVNYNFDGIEGYIFPPNEPQPEGTVKLYRRYHYDRDDHAIFPESLYQEMQAAGYTHRDGSAERCLTICFVTRRNAALHRLLLGFWALIVYA
jgi:hypothetical protein